MKKFLLQALAGFLFWTLALTPYMFCVVKISLNQYLSWVVLQLIFVPPLAPLSVYFINWFEKKLGNKK